jgi:hypothetical protein
MTQLQFGSGLAIASGHQIVLSVLSGRTTRLAIRGYLTRL